MDDKHKFTYDLLIRQLGIQYSLLLGYRALFVTVNTFLLPFALRFVSTPDSQPTISMLLAILGFGLCTLWYFSTEYRRYNVYFLERELLEFEKEPSYIKVQTELVNWQKNKKHYKVKTLECSDSGRQVMSCSGSQIMNILRASFFIIWFLIFMWALYHGGSDKISELFNIGKANAS